MSSVDLPQPQEIDEQRYMELQIVADEAMLRAHAQSEDRCLTCRYYLEPEADLSYCWHPDLRLLVGGHWWCQWWYSAAEG